MIFNTYSACLSPFSASVRTRILLTVVSAVSAEEKKADIKSSSIKINSCIPSPELKKLNSYLPL